MLVWDTIGEVLNRFVGPEAPFRGPILAMLTMLVLLGRDLFSQRFVGATLILNPVAVAMDAAGSTMRAEGARSLRR